MRKMEVEFYKNVTDEEKGSGPIGRFFKSLRSERPPDLWMLVKKVIEDVRESENLKVFEDDEWVGRLRGTKERLYEFRIPPRRSNGVVRLYFGYKVGNEKKIIILSAELKKNGRKQADKNKIKQAEQRYKEVCK